MAIQLDVEDPFAATAAPKAQYKVPLDVDDPFSSPSPKQQFKVSLDVEDPFEPADKTETPSFLSKVVTGIKEGMPEIIPALKSGYEHSATGLGLRLATGGQGMPEPFEPKTFLGKAAQGTGQMVSELPEMAMGSAAGGATAGLAGIETGPGAVIAAGVGAGAGAFAVPAALRTAFRQKLQGQELDAGEIVKETLKEGAIGGLTGGVGGAVGRAALAPEARAMYDAAFKSGGAAAAAKVIEAAKATGLFSSGIGNIARPAAEIATMTTANTLPEGRLPNVEELALNAVPIAGLHAAQAITRRLSPSRGAEGTAEEYQQQMREVVTPDKAGAVPIQDTRPTEKPAEVPGELPEGVPGNVTKGDLSKSVSEQPETQAEAPAIPEHIARAIETKRDFSPELEQKMKPETKANIYDKIDVGEINPDEVVIRMTGNKELASILESGKLTEGQDFEGRSGISAQEVGGQKPIVAYGEGMPVAMIVTKDAVISRGEAPNEVKINPEFDPKKARYMIDGFPEILSFDQLKTEMEKRKATEAVAPESPIEKTGGFVAKDLKPAIEATRSEFIKAGKALRDTLVPVAAGEPAKKTAYSMRKNLSVMQRNLDQADAALESARKLFSGMDEKSRLDFLYRIESDTEQPSQGLNVITRKMRNILDTARDEVRGLSTGALERFYRNYFPHIWKDPEKAADFIQEWYGKRPLEGSKAFLEARSIPTIKEGIEAGLEIAFDNPVDAVMFKLREMNKYIMSQRVIKDMKAEGIFKFVRAIDAPPEGWTKINDRISTVTYRNKDGERVISGYYYAPKEATEIMNNYLSPGLRDKPMFNVAMTASNVLNQFQLGFSAFHLGFTSLDAMISKVALGMVKMSHGEYGKGLKDIAISPAAPLRNIQQGAKAYREWMVPGSEGTEVGKIVTALQHGGMRAQQDRIYQTKISKNMVKALKEGNILGGILRAPFAAVEQVSRPIMEYIVPRQKMGVAVDLAKYELQRKPNMSPEELSRTMSAIWDSVDNRMGQLVYDNLFWNKAVKDLGMISVRSLGWNLGTFREVGGGLVDMVRQARRVHKGDNPEMTYKMAYTLSLPLATGLLGAVTQYLMTGKGPDEFKDYFYPKTGGLDMNGNPERVSLPSYMKDLYHYYSKPGQTLINKLNPAMHLVAEMLQNKDFYGVQIRNEDDPIVKQAASLALHAAKGFEPFSSRGMRKTVKTEGGVTAKSLLPFVGITPAPGGINKTKAEEMVSEIIRERMPKGSRTAEQAEKGDLKRQLRRDLYKTGDTQPIQDALLARKITPAEAQRIIRSQRETPLQHGFTHLGIEDAIKVYEAATPKERETLRPLLNRKRYLLRAMEPEKRQEVLQTLRAALRSGR